MAGEVRIVNLIEEYWFNMLDTLKSEAIAKVMKYSGVDCKARPLKPDDLDGTANTFQTTATTVTAVRCYGAAATPKIDTGQGMLFVGWYAPEDFDTDGYLQIKVEGVERNMVAAQFVYNMPGHVLYTPDQLVFLKQNSNFNVYLYNGQAANITSGAGPLGYIIGPPEQLLIG